MRQAGPGALRRLALAEAAAISWQAGGRVAAERLALHDLDRADMGRDDAGALGAAHWALRRLAVRPGGGPGPEHGLDAFLAREGVAADPAVPGWKDGLAALGAALPLVRAAWGFSAWRTTGLSAGVLEPAVIAARLGGAEGRGPGFLPLAQVAAPYFAGGDAAARLAAWARAAEAGALRALMTIDALAAWQARATAATARLTGRTPRLLIAALLASPAVSAGMAARATTGTSTAGARRNLGRLEAAGLVREITGQGRFRPAPGQRPPRHGAAVPRSGSRRKPRGEWLALKPGAHEGYVSWERAEAIRAMVSDNVPASRHHGAPKHGDALLAGLVRCRRCGRKLTVRYTGAKHDIPRYSCWRGLLDNGEPRCIAFGGLRVDDAIEELLLRVVEPGALAAASEAEVQAANRRDQVRDQFRSDPISHSDRIRSPIPGHPITRMMPWHRCC